MHRFFIIGTNCLWLALLLIGLPAATHLQLGSWEISSAATGWLLLFWGLAAAVAGNILAAIAFAKGRKVKMLCWEWAAVFGGLLLVGYGFRRGYFNFHWLQQTLLWLQKHF